MKKAKLNGVRGKGRTSRTVFLGRDGRHAIADYLETERPGDTDEQSKALFLAACSIGARRPGGRLSPRSVNTIVGEIGRIHDTETADRERQLRGPPPPRPEAHLRLPALGNQWPQPGRTRTTPRSRQRPVPAALHQPTRGHRRRLRRRPLTSPPCPRPQLRDSRRRRRPHPPHRPPLPPRGQPPRGRRAHRRLHNAQDHRGRNRRPRRSRRGEQPMTSPSPSPARQARRARSQRRAPARGHRDATASSGKGGTILTRDVAARVRQLAAQAEHRRAIAKFRARHTADQQARVNTLLLEAVAALAGLLTAPASPACPGMPASQPLQHAPARATAPPKP